MLISLVSSISRKRACRTALRLSHGLASGTHMTFDWLSTPSLLLVLKLLGATGGLLLGLVVMVMSAVVVVLVVIVVVVVVVMVMVLCSV